MHISHATYYAYFLIDLRDQKLIHDCVVNCKYYVRTCYIGTSSQHLVVKYVRCVEWDVECAYTCVGVESVCSGEWSVECWGVGQCFHVKV